VVVWRVVKMSTVKVKLSWDSAIQDAEREIEKAMCRIAVLRKSIRIFQERKLAGDKFLDEHST
jgi:hypothetical protein